MNARSTKKPPIVLTGFILFACLSILLSSKNLGIYWHASAQNGLWRVFTAMCTPNDFVFAICTMLILFTLGFEVEHMLGHLKTFVIMISSAVIAGIFVNFIYVDLYSIYTLSAGSAGLITFALLYLIIDRKLIVDVLHTTSENYFNCLVATQLCVCIIILIAMCYKPYFSIVALLGGMFGGLVNYGIYAIIAYKRRKKIEKYFEKLDEAARYAIAASGIKQVDVTEVMNSSNSTEKTSEIEVDEQADNHSVD